MLNLIVLLCFVGGTVAAAIQIPKLRKGWVHPKFQSDPAKFRASKLKEYAILAVAGIVCGALFVGMGFLEDRRPAQLERFVIGGIMIACGAIGFWMRTLLPRP